MTVNGYSKLTFCVLVILASIFPIQLKAQPTEIKWQEVNFTDYYNSVKNNLNSREESELIDGRSRVFWHCDAYFEIRYQDNIPTIGVDVSNFRAIGTTNFRPGYSAFYHTNNESFYVAIQNETKLYRYVLNASSYFEGLLVIEQKGQNLQIQTGWRDNVNESMTYSSKCLLRP